MYDRRHRGAPPVYVIDRAAIYRPLDKEKWQFR